MALGSALKALFREWAATLSEAFPGFWAKLLQAIFALVFWVAIFYLPHLVWPKIDLKILNIQMSRYDGRLRLVSFDLDNESYLNLKDPEIACDMKGQSGTSIRMVSKVIYEVLPSEQKRRFSDVEMGEIPEQVAYFSCYVSGASVKW
jgi:hypothetical protein